MREKVVLLLVALVFIASVCAAADIKVRIVDKSGIVVLDNFLSVLTLTAADSQIMLQLRDPVALSNKVIKLKIDGVEKEATQIDLSISTVIIPTPVTPAPIPPLLTRPVPPFPNCWWGMEPMSKEGLFAYISTGGGVTQSWADWLKAHPEDLDWMWVEYKKSNP